MSATATNPLGTRARHQAKAFGALTRAGVLRLDRPDRAARTLRALLGWGATPAAAAAINAIRYPGEAGLVDDDGVLTFAELHARSNALAHALAERGIGPGDGVAIFARNHRWFVDATLAASKLGAKALFLNSSFSGPQAHEVLARERPKVVTYDSEFADLMAAGDAGGALRFVAYPGEGEAPGAETLGDLIAAGNAGDLRPPPEPGASIILTSGTTGPPKGATRAAPAGIGAVGGLLERVPYRVRETMVNAAPLFHTWGWGQFIFASTLADTLVLRRRFDPEATLKAVHEQRAEILVVIPVMLSRILALDPVVRDRYDTSSLKIVFASGSALPSELARRWREAYGENLYNLYGSTEVAWATIATPADLRDAPGTTGRPPFDTQLKVLDGEGLELPCGHTGRIFVGSELTFEGYTNGGSKEVVGGLMSTGDMGHLDAAGRLFIDSREDDMVISGGENVYPGEVEDLLIRHPSIEDAAVIGVADKEFGQVLKAFVVAGAPLSADEVCSFVRDNLARFKVPKTVEFLDELPRNATGKVLKRELALR